MTAELLKMRFELPEEDGYESTAEWLWVKPLPDGLFLVDSIPFEIMGISADDTVSGHLANGHLNFSALVRQSGNRTLRLKLKQKNIGWVIGELQLERVEYEGSQMGENPLYSFNLPPSFDYTALKEKLEALEDAGVIEYEEANV